MSHRVKPTNEKKSDEEKEINKKTVKETDQRNWKMALRTNKLSRLLATLIKQKGRYNLTALGMKRGS